MRKKFSYMVFILIVLIVCCEKNPLEYNKHDLILIECLGKQTEHAEKFRFVNKSDFSTWYWGYGDGFPLYKIQIKTDNSWKGGFVGWCGTGAGLRELAPSSSVDFSAGIPTNACVWRVGITLYNEDEEEDQSVWSKSLLKR